MPCPTLTRASRATDPARVPTHRALRGLVLLALTLGVAPTLTAEPPRGGSYTLRKHVIAAGGTASSGGSYALVGTVGQSLTGAIDSARFQIQQGFHTGQAQRPDALFNDGFE